MKMKQGNSVQVGIFVLMQAMSHSLLIVFNGVFDVQKAIAVPASMAIDPRDAICYMETADGRVLDLSRFCGRQDNRPVSLTGLDQRFLSDYQTALRRRYSRSSAAQTALSQAQQNPQSVIQRAREACARIQNGMLPELALMGEGRVDSAIVNDLALNRFCPELDD